MKKQMSIGHKILSVLLCLTLTVSMVAMDGFAFAVEMNAPQNQSEYSGTEPGVPDPEPGTDTPPAADQGKVGVTLEVGTASAASTSNTMLAVSEDGISPLNFSAVTVAGDNQPVGVRVRTITFQDGELTFETANNPYDSMEILLADVPDAVYARQIGEGGISGEDNVVAYLVAADDGSGNFDMIVCGPGGVTAPADCSVLFAGKELNSKGQLVPAPGWQSGLERIDLTHFNTAQAENLMALFYYCENLTEIIGIEDLDLRNADSVFGMFRNCAALTDMDLSAWRTPKLTNASYLFANCGALESVDLSWPNSNLANVTTLRNMFSQDHNLETITGVEDWVLPEVTELTAFFYECKKLTSLNLTAWKPEKVTCISHMFNKCSALANLTIEGWNLPELELMSSTFVLSGLEEIDLSTWTNLDKVNYFYATFQLCRNLKTVKLPGVGNAGYAKIDFYITFGQSEALEELDLSGWVFDSDTHLRYDSLKGAAFWGNQGNGPTDTKITADNIEIKDTAKIQTAKFPWVENVRAKPVLVSANNWNLNDTEQDLSNLLTKIQGANTITDFSGWTGLAGVTHMDDMFKGGTVLETVDLSGADMSSLQSAKDMFNGVSTLTEINLTGWTGITDKTVLEGIFNGVDIADVTLSVDSDTEIGQWLQAEFDPSAPTSDAPAPTTNEASAPQEPASLPAAPETPETPESHPTYVDLTDEALPPLAAEPVLAPPQAERTAARSAPAEAGGTGTSESPVTVHSEATPVGAEVPLLATVRYEGVTGTQSGRIELNIPLPASMAAADNADIKMSGFKYTTDTGAGPLNGTVVTAPEIKIENGVTTLHAVFDDMYAGTEIEVSFKTKLTDTPLVNGYRLWDVAAHAQDANTQAASTLRLWWSEDNTPPTVRTVTYQLTNLTAAPQPSIAIDGKPFSITLKPASGMKIETVNVEMNGLSVTETAYDSSTSKIEIAAVNGDIHIEATAAATGGEDGGGSVGGGGGGASSQLTVKYDIDSKLASTKDKTSETLNSGAKPTKIPVVTVKDAEKNVFVGWTLDPNAEKLTLDDPKEVVITRDTTFYAVFARIEEHGHYIKGYDSGIFAPAENISRAQVAAIIARACLDGFDENNNYGNGGYNDVASDHWAAGAIAYCTEKGILEGMGEGVFEPDRAITRQEFALVIARMAGLVSAGDMPFTDAGTTADWAMSGVYTAFAKGWLNGYEDGTFKPWSNITRSEAVKIVNRYLNRGVDKDGISNVSGDLKQWPDVPESHWAYYEIIEASNDHTFYFTNGANPPEVYTKAYVEEVSRGE